MRTVLNGLLGGLHFRRRLLMPIQAWTLTLISLTTRKRKSPSPQTIPENQIPPLRSNPLLHPLLLPQMADLSHTSLVALFFFFFLFVGLGTHDICSLLFNEYPFFISSLSHLLVFFVLFCMNRIDFSSAWPESST